MAAAEKAPVSRKRARVRGFQNQMAAVLGDEHFFANGKASPQQKDQVFLAFGKALDNRIGKLLPADLRVGGSLVRADGQACVQQKNTLVCPVFEVTALWKGDAHVVVEFLENVHKGRWRLDAVGYGKAEPVCLSRIVLRILADDDRFDLVHRAFVEGCKNLRSRRVHGVLLLFFCKDLFQVQKVRLLKLVFEHFKPCRI